MGDGELLEAVAVTLWDAIKRDKAYLRAGITEKQAAEMAVLIYQRYWQNLTQRPVDDLKPEDLPEQMKRVCAI